MREKIREYWDERARSYSGSVGATTDDVYLRELEIFTIVTTLRELDLPKPARVLDVGCGDGYSTLKVADTFRDMQFLGIDFSEGMIKIARQRLEARPDLMNHVAFIVGDVTDVGQVCGDSVYDVALTDRCLINLNSSEVQSEAIARIAEHTRPGGFYIAIENFVEGHEKMNETRGLVGLPPIPVRWHNLYFKEDEFVRAAGCFFEDIVFKNFSSSYYFATRVIYSAMCQMRGEVPDYHHEIHQLAVRLPWFGEFSPIRMAVMRRRKSSPMSRAVAVSR